MLPAPPGEYPKRKQLEYDGLGRLTSVCELTSAAGSGTCGQTTPQTGYWTRYMYDALNNLTGVTQNAQGTAQTRTYSYDGLGRLISETNPETGATTYTYDSVNSGACNISNPGDLVMKVDAAGNGSCYVYDALHRLSSIGQSYANSPNASATPDRCFKYDSGTVNGVAMSNVKGRLAEAYTVAQGAGCAAAKVTDEGFSYSARGELTDVYQYTPHSGGYYHVNAAYWPHGILQSFSGLPGTPTISYGVDGVGRVSSVTANSGQNPVSSAGYYNSGQPFSLTFGSGDSDTFSYDTNTGRMTQYQSNINGQTVAGNLAWNANGSLAQAATTDPFNSANNQVCGYTYDDLGRLSTTNCGPIVTTWNANGGTGISHLCGRPDGDGWSVNVFNDPSGCWMQYGPYTTQLGAGSYVAQWTLLADNNSADNNTILRLDINDSTANTQLGYMYVTREQFTSPNVYQTFSLPFTLNSSQAGHQLEFRIYWYGYSYIREKNLDYATSSSWAQTFGFDPFGNISKSGSSSFQASYATATNRITSISNFVPSYDANGNLTNDSSHTYAWDADGHAVAIDSVAVTYDVLGRMVEQNKGGMYYQIVYGPTGGKLAIMSGQTVQEQFVPLPAGATAVYTSTGLTYYRHADWLGSTRLASTPSRGVWGETAYAPFGEPYANTALELSFTGQNQDTVTGLYDFMFREYHPTQGRWISPDPAGLAAVDLANPQSWNRYAYVMNYPTFWVDPLGLAASVDHLMAVGPCLFWVHEDFEPVRQTKITLLGCRPPAMPMVEPWMIEEPNESSKKIVPKKSSECSKYLEAADQKSGKALNFLCRSFPDDPWSQRMRGCLQQLYNPKSGYLLVPVVVPLPYGPNVDVNELIPGTGAHAACALQASGVQ
jgi:RHS repeat-associated protein